MSEKPRRMLRPTMADVAREAGVSLSTVDRVLNLRADVRADTAQRIAAAAARLGFHAKGVIEQRVLNDRPTLRLGFLLQKSGVPFYQGLAHALSNAAATCTRARIRVVIGYLDDLDPVIVAQRILALRDQVDGLGVVAVGSSPGPGGGCAIARDRCFGGGAAVGAVQRQRHGVCRVGQSTHGPHGRLVHQPSGEAARAAAVMLSSQRFQCQELCELSFRSYLAEHSSEWELLASRLTLEDDEFAYGNTLDLLTAEPDLVGLYVAGGGIAGVLRALRSLQEQQIRLPVVVCHDLTPLTREALKTGLVQAVLSHPVVTMAEQAVEALVEAATATSPGPAPRRVVSLQIDVSESV